MDVTTVPRITRTARMIEPEMPAATQRASRLDGLAEIGRAAAGAADRMAFLPLVSRKAVEMLDARACQIWLSEDGPVLVATYRAPGAEIDDAPDAGALEACLAGEIVSGDAWLCVPIPSDPDPAGVLAIARDGAWSPDDIALAETTASMIDLGLEIASAGRLDDQSRSQFLALIGHDLRSPLANVRVGAQLAERNLAAGDLDSVRQALRIIESQSNRLVARLEALLDAVAADGHLLIRLESVDLAALAETVVEPLRLAAQESGAGTRFAVAVEPETPPARCDRVQIGQVLEHLLDNAAKYAVGKDVAVTIAPAGANVRVDVCDNGPGIRPEDVERVFAPFGRGQAAAGKEGYGLGLYLARNIVAAHGGRLVIARTSRSGTCFSLTVPAATDSMAIGAPALDPAAGDGA
jgi:signal transduction histidine kinase